MAERARIKYLLPYVDDFLSIGRPETGECRILMDTMSATCKTLGGPLADEKEDGPATWLVFLGIQLDSVAQKLSLPPGKLEELVALVKSWSDRDRCTKTELQSLIGSLMFATKCIPAGRLFTRRMIRLLSSSNSESHPPRTQCAEHGSPHLSANSATQAKPGSLSESAGSYVG